MNRKWIAAILAGVLLLCSACAAKASYENTTSYDMAAAEEAGYPQEAAEEPRAYSYSAAASGADMDAGETTETDVQSQAGDIDVRKIIYNASLSVTADAPEKALSDLTEKAKSLGGYLSASNTYTDEYGVYQCSATLKVPADKLEELVNAAQASGKVVSYQLYSDDISLSYYDIQARLANAKAEEAQLTEILNQCQSVEDVLLVREQLSAVRGNIESYQGQINLWDNLVSYATMELSVQRTARTVVEDEDELLALWKASDVWNRMKTGFMNTARFMVNAVGAIGIFVAYAAIPGGLILLVVLLWRKLSKNAAARRQQRKAKRMEAKAKKAEKRAEKLRKRQLKS